MRYAILIWAMLGLVWGQKMNPRKFMVMDHYHSPYPKKAEEASHAEQYRKAIYYYTKEIRNKRTKDKAWFYARRAMLYIELGQYDKAIADYSVLIRMSKKPANFYYQRAKVRATAGDLGDAICDIDSAIALSKAPLTYFLARAEFKSLGGDLAGALADCQIAMGIQPTDGGSYFTKGISSGKQGGLARFLTTCRFLPTFAILKYNFIRTFLPAKKVPKKAALAKPASLGQPEAEICYDEGKWLIISRKSYIQTIACALTIHKFRPLIGCPNSIPTGQWRGRSKQPCKNFP